MVVAEVAVVGAVHVVAGGGVGGVGGVGVDVGHWCSGLFAVRIAQIPSAVVWIGCFWKGRCFGFDGFEKFGRRWHRSTFDVSPKIRIVARRHAAVANPRCQN